MIRKDKEIIELKEIESIIHRSKVCRLAICDESYPYIVPLCFGYSNHTLYFHSASAGKKIDLLKKNTRVGFEFDIDHKVKKSDKACHWGMQYKSVVGFGKATFILEPALKKKALDIIMQQYTKVPYQFKESKIKGTAVIKVEIEQITGKQSL